MLLLDALDKGGGRCFPFLFLNSARTRCVGAVNELERRLDASVARAGRFFYLLPPPFSPALFLQLSYNA